MSELESLVSQASALNSKVDFWNTAVVWALLITALAAGAIVFSQRLAFVRAKQLADVQDKIAKIKEGNASDRADGLDQANIRLRTDLQTETGKVAGLEKAASDAKAAQQRVETDLAQQRERTAIAEKAFLDLKRQTAPRRVNSEQRKKFLAAITIPSGKGTSILVTPMFTAPDAEDFSRDLAALLHDAGFSVSTDTALVGFPPPRPRGLRISAGKNRFADREALVKALIAAGLATPPVEGVNADDQPDFLSLVVGTRIQ